MVINNRKIQWGTATSTSVTFDRAFYYTPIVLTTIDYSTVGIRSVTDVTKTGFLLVGGGVSSTLKVYWLAIG